MRDRQISVRRVLIYGHLKNITLRNHERLLEDEQGLHEISTETFHTTSTWQLYRLL